MAVLKCLLLAVLMCILIQVSFAARGAPLSESVKKSTCANPPCRVLKPPKCTPDQDGIFPHPYDTTKFINCAGGLTYIRNCGEGTFYNIDVKACTYEEQL